ncbi:MAG: primosomal protein N' [Acidobacteriota bacterium]|nr:primosomal protein N' [Acidobacteriota bacterium]
MPEYCDVALPVPLDATFTYRVAATAPVVGGRVLVPFGQQRMAGVVVRLHDDKPSVKTKEVLEALDAAPLLEAPLLELAEWIANYYLAPLGEVFRTMLPVMAEVRRIREYRITDVGHTELYRASELGSSRRSQRTPAEQDVEYAVLNHLSDREVARETALRSATGASRALLAGMLRKKWIAWQDVSESREQRRVAKVVVLKQVEGKLNDAQRTIVEALAASGGRLHLATLHGLEISASSLKTLEKRGVVAIEEEPQDFHLTSMKARKRDYELNAEQQKAFEHVTAAAQAGEFSVSLLYGVTGSGKTAVYLAAMQEALAAGKSALMLVPEIGLTPAAAAHLYEIFGDEVAILHSGLTPGERTEQWRRIHAGGARIVVGTRSAVFAPLPELALIVVDEEQDSSYKQEETPRYHGRDVAVMRGKLTGAAVVLGSATPSLESFHNAKKQKYALLELRERVEQRALPGVELVDMKVEFAETGADHLFSRKLTEEITACLARGEQAMILLNRRGYSAIVLCRSCGEKIECVNCAIALTYHKGANKLECHYCGYKRPVPKTCPKCGSEHIYFLGSGSEKLEDVLQTAFPGARIGRMDRDTIRGRGDFERVLNQMHAGEIDLLVGTQMIAKGHDVPGVTLVGVVGADFALGFPDFRAAERTFQLLTQVAGRAGRGETPGRVILQTFFPDHYAIQFAAQHDYDGFFEKEIRYRGWMHYPPFTALANVLVRSDKLEHALRWAGMLGRWFEANVKPKTKGLRVLGPAAAPIVRLKRDYRYHFVLKSDSRKRLNEILRAMLGHAVEQKIPRTNVIVDVDPLSLL